jgi:ATP-dependent RNA helicase RhlE
MGQQIQALRRNPHIIVATPGRMNDHLQQKTVSLQNTKIIVLDEADRMLDIGFMPQIVEILKNAPKERQTLMFSATMPQSIASLAARFMKLPLRIEVAPSGTPAANVEQEIFITPKDLKIVLLEKILKDSTGQVLVFSRTKHGAKKIANNLRNAGCKAVEIHSDRTLAQRRNAMDGFKSGQYRILVATDIAARGIDVNDIATVVNYDLPGNSEDYVHRIGRTGRAGKYGKAISFATPDQRNDIKQIERLIKKSIPISAMPALQPRQNVVRTNFHQNERSEAHRRPFKKNDFFSFRGKKQNPKRKRYGIIN